MPDDDPALLGFRTNRCTALIVALRFQWQLFPLKQQLVTFVIVVFITIFKFQWSQRSLKWRNALKLIVITVWLFITTLVVGHFAFKL